MCQETNRKNLREELLFASSCPTDKESIEDAKTYRLGIVLGIVVGSVFSAAGFILALLGLSGKVEWILETSGVTSRLTNAGPGVAFSLMGMLIIWRYKPNIAQEGSDELSFTESVTSSDVPTDGAFRPSSRSGVDGETGDSQSLSHIRSRSHSAKVVRRRRKVGSRKRRARWKIRHKTS